MAARPGRCAVNAGRAITSGNPLSPVLLMVGSAWLLWWGLARIDWDHTPVIAFVGRAIDSTDWRLDA